MRNLREQVKKAFCDQKLFWPFTVWINCSSDLKNFVNSQPSLSNLKSFSQTLEQFFLTVGQNNFDNKIPFLLYSYVITINNVHSMQSGSCSYNPVKQNSEIWNINLLKMDIKIDCQKNMLIFSYSFNWMTWIIWPTFLLLKRKITFSKWDS